jgi:hypothetical protein
MATPSSMPEDTNSPETSVIANVIFVDPQRNYQAGYEMAHPYEYAFITQQYIYQAWLGVVRVHEKSPSKILRNDKSAHRVESQKFEEASLSPFSVAAIVFLLFAVLFICIDFKAEKPLVPGNCIVMLIVAAIFLYATGMAWQYGKGGVRHI